MAFKPNSNISEMIQKSSNISQTANPIDLSKMPGNQHTKSYGFTLEPKVRKKLSLVAQQNGYTSDSRFLNDLIKNCLTVK